MKKKYVYVVYLDHNAMGNGLDLKPEAAFNSRSEANRWMRNFMKNEAKGVPVRMSELFLVEKVRLL